MTGMYTISYLGSDLRPIRFPEFAFADTGTIPDTMIVDMAMKITFDSHLEITGLFRQYEIASTSQCDTRGSLRYRYLADGFIMDINNIHMTMSSAQGIENEMYSGTMSFFDGEYTAPFEWTWSINDTATSDSSSLRVLSAPLLNRNSEKIGTVELHDDSSVTLRDANGAIIAKGQY